MALEVSSSGVTVRMTAGMAAEKLPTPNPRIAISSSSSARSERARAKSAKAPNTTTALAAAAGSPVRLAGDVLEQARVDAGAHALGPRLVQIGDLQSRTVAEQYAGRHAMSSGSLTSTALEGQ